MLLLPAIDLLGGKVVRLSKGSYDAVTIYNDDPVEQAYRFIEAGARWIHIVDLDGARSGVPMNADVIERILAASHADGHDISIEIGGGVRTLDALNTWAEAGVSRIVVGTRLAKDPAFVDEAVKLIGDRLVAGVDARDGEVAVSGWEKGSGIPVHLLVKRLSNQGIRHMVYTDISRDGMQTGIDATAYRLIANLAGFPVVASGGIGSLDDIRALAELGDDKVEGAIVGRALYEGTFPLSAALDVCRRAAC